MSMVPVSQYDLLEAGARVLTRHINVDYDNYDFDGCESNMFRALPLIEVDVYAALMWAKGNLSLAADVLNRPRRVLTDWLKANPEMYQVIDEIRERRLDTIQDKVIAQAELGDGTQARFVLSTIGKDRGFTTRVENTGKDGAPLEHVIRDRVSDDQLLRIANEIRAQIGTVEGEYNVIDG